MLSLNFNMKYTWCLLFLAIYIVEETHQYHVLDAVQFVNRTRRQTRCRPGEFQCVSGDCIQDYEKCDGSGDCPDDSDETEKVCRNERCTADNFRCQYGACIPKRNECDGEKNCVDYSDEDNDKCRKEKPTPDCRPTQFTCTDGECIEKYLKCDGSQDCTDGSDETFALCKEEKCPEFAFRCKYGACLSSKVKCNGVKDCPDGSDEEPTMCGYATTTTPTPGSGPTVVTKPQQPTDCQLPAQPGYGTYKVDGRQEAVGSWVRSGALLTYKCRPNYQLVPNRAFIPCQNGKWVYDIPDCIATCPPRVSNTVEYTCTLKGIPQTCSERLLDGTTVNMKCKFFHYEKTRNTPRRLTCKEGTWDYPPIICEPECGKREGTPSQQFAIGAQNAKIIDHPWHVGIYRREKNVGDIVHKCGGTIINPNVIVSAAHCFSDPTNGNPYPADEFYVAAGKTYRDYNAKQDEETVQKRRVKTVVLHENYKAYTRRYADDIALAILDTPLLPNTLTTTICVDVDSRVPFQPNEKGTVVGWGVTELEGRLGDPHLKVLNLPIIDNDDCFRVVPQEFQAYVTTDKICAGYTNGSSVCQGDSGGGLIVEIDGINYIRGIVSNGPVKGFYCDNRQVGAYTAISEFSDFVNSARYFYYD